MNSLVELIVELLAVGDHHEGPVAGLRRSTFWVKKSIERLLPEPCVCQNTPSRPRASPFRASARIAAFTPSTWWFWARTLTQAARPLEVGDEVLDEVEQARRLAEPADRGLERDDAGLGLIVDPLPVAEPLPRRERRADLRLRAVRQDHERVRREQLRDRVAVVGEVLVVRLLDRLVGRLQLQQHQRDPVDETDDVGAPVCSGPTIQSC